MPTLSWSALNILAWIFGLKAAYDLRAEFDPRSRTWTLFTWAVWSCLLMELAMVGAPYAAGLSLFSTLTGITSGVLLGAASVALRRDVDADQPARLGSAWWDRAVAGAYPVSAVSAIAVAHALPATNRSLTGILHVVEGGVWLVVPGALAAIAFFQPAVPAVRRETCVHMPRALGVAFVFAVAGAAVTPLTRLTGWRIDAAFGNLFSTLFILTLVTTLYAMVLQVRSAKLVNAMTELHGARDQLFGAQKLVAVGTLAAGAAHDFNNTLTAILGYATLALDDKTLSPQTREDLNAIQQSATGAATLTNNLLGIARKQGGRAAYANLAETVRAPLDSLAREFARQQINVVTRFDPVPSPPVDLGLLFQVFLNLYLNARDAMIQKGGGVLEVSLYSIGRAVEVAVKDTGGGIPEAFRSRIFQPLQTTKGASGTGLGLSVSRSVVESMGGRIRYESTEGEGTTFYVTLPVLERGTADAADPGKSARPGIGTSGSELTARLPAGRLHDGH